MASGAHALRKGIGDRPPETLPRSRSKKASGTQCLERDRATDAPNQAAKFSNKKNGCRIQPFFTLLARLPDKSATSCRQGQTHRHYLEEIGDMGPNYNTLPG